MYIVALKETKFSKQHTEICLQTAKQVIQKLELLKNLSAVKIQVICFCRFTVKSQCHIFLNESKFQVKSSKINPVRTNYP